MSATVVTAGLGHNAKIPTRGFGGVLAAGAGGGPAPGFRMVPHWITTGPTRRRRVDEKAPSSSAKPLAYFKAGGESIPIVDQEIPERMTREGLAQLPDFPTKVAAAARELAVDENTAADALTERANRELELLRQIKRRHFKSDMQLIEVLLIADLI